MLRSAAGEEEDYLQTIDGGAGEALPALQRANRFLAVAADDRSSVLERPPAHLQRVRDVGERLFGIAQMRRKPGRRAIERIGGARGKNEELMIAGGRAGRLLLRLLENDMGVRTANAERAHARAADVVALRPLAKLRVDEERAIREVDGRICFR